MIGHRSWAAGLALAWATQAQGTEPATPVPPAAVAAFQAGAFDRAGTTAQTAAMQCFNVAPAKPRCLDLLVTAARYLVAARRFEEATLLARLAKSTAEEQSGPDSREMAAALIVLGPAEGGRDNPGLGVNLLAAAVAILRKTDPDSLALADAISFGAAAEDAEEFVYKDQEERHREAIRIATARGGERAPVLAPFYLRLGRNLQGQGRWGEAEAAYRKGLDLGSAVDATEPRLAEQLYAGLGATLDAQGRATESVPVLRRALALDAARTGEDGWLHVAPLRALAEALLRQGATEEAGALLDRAERAAQTDARHRADESLLALARGRLREANGDLRGAEASYRLAGERWGARKDEVIGLFRAYEIDRALARDLYAQRRYAEAFTAYQAAAQDIESVGFIEGNPLQVDAAGDVAVARVVTGGDVGLARDELRLATERAVTGFRSVTASPEDLSAIRHSREYFKALVGADWQIAARLPPAAGTE